MSNDVLDDYLGELLLEAVPTAVVAAPAASAKPPAFEVPGDSAELEAVFEAALAEAAARIKEQGGTTHAFFAKGKEDLSVTLTPCLFEKHEVEAETATDDVSEEVLEQFSEDKVEGEEL